VEESYKLAGFGLIALVFGIMSIPAYRKFQRPGNLLDEGCRRFPAFCLGKICPRLKKTDLKERERLLLGGYQLDPKDRKINYTLGKHFNEQKEYAKAEKYSSRKRNFPPTIRMFFLSLEVSITENSNLTRLLITSGKAWILPHEPAGKP